MSGRVCVICGSTTTYIKKEGGFEQWFKNPNGEGFICRKCHDKGRKKPASEEKVKCECGHCDEWIPRYNNWGRENHYAFGHSKTKVKKNSKTELVRCQCGKCDEMIPKYYDNGHRRYYVRGHSHRKEVTKDKDYEYVFAPNHPYRNHRNKVYRHRLVIEEYYTKKWGIKFYLHPSIPVHHKDENPKNNHISNLEIKLKPEHTGDHRRLDKEDWFCLFCHEKTYIDRKGKEQWYEYNSGHICMKCYKNFIKV